ncbi:MAG TPA: AraC family transcriptional regulator [Campylobacterales bacterium]|jgi:AraC-like DNA-binding protein|nr:AraC family transcriptional regulator [Campylobacterales bacterium]
MKVESSIYVTILGIKFTIKEKHNKWHIAFNDSEGKRVNRSMKLESSKKNLIVVKNDLLPQIAQELNSRKQSTMSTVVNSDDVILDNISDEMVPTIKYLEQNFKSDISIDEIAKFASMSIPSLHKNFKQATSLSPILFIKQLRLHNAHSLLLSGYNACNTAFESEYTNSAQFSRELKVN